MTAPPGHVSVNDAMILLGISRQRVYQLVGLRRLPSTKVAGRVWIPMSAVEERLAGERRLTSNQCVTTQEVADFFGVNERTIREWHAIGALKATTINNQLCFAPTDVAAFVPPYSGGAGRSPGKKATRTIRGRYFPPPPGPRRESDDA